MPTTPTKTNSTTPEQNSPEKTSPSPPKASIYTQDDSDNESDFEQLYENPTDDFADLKTLQDKPLYLSDLIMGLQSEQINRFTIAINHAEQLIRSQNSNDLCECATSLLETLFRIDNKFD